MNTSATVHKISAKVSTEKDSGIKIELHEADSELTSDTLKTAKCNEDHGKIEIGSIKFDGQMAESHKYGEGDKAGTHVYVLTPGRELTDQEFKGLYKLIGKDVDFTFEASQKTVDFKPVPEEDAA